MTSIDEYLQKEAIAFAEWASTDASNFDEFNSNDFDDDKLGLGEWRYEGKTLTTKELYKIFKDGQTI